MLSCVWHHEPPLALLHAKGGWDNGLRRQLHYKPCQLHHILQYTHGYYDTFMKTKWALDPRSHSKGSSGDVYSLTPIKKRSITVLCAIYILLIYDAFLKINKLWTRDPTVKGSSLDLHSLTPIKKRSIPLLCVYNVYYSIHHSYSFIFYDIKS